MTLCGAGGWGGGRDPAVRSREIAQNAHVKGGFAKQQSVEATCVVERRQMAAGIVGVRKRALGAQ